MDINDRILQIIRIKGPVVPADISKEIESNIIMTSAFLSELVSNKKLKISNLKIGGGSPLYYAPGQEPRLQQFAKYLNDKNRHAFEYLKEKKILKDSELSPLMRVALREIKDFSKPLEVTLNDKTEIFWKWYLLDNEEAGNLIKEKLGMKPKKDKPIAAPSEEIPKEEEKTPKKKIEQEALKEDERPKVIKKIINLGMKKEEEEQKVEKKIIEDKQEILISEDNLAEWKHAESDFINTLKNYFIHRNIEVTEANIRRKHSDIEFILDIDSSIGNITFFCKAKNKKKINDGDISSAFIEGQIKKLPIMLIVTGDMTKKAKNLLSTELKGVTVVKI